MITSRNNAQIDVLTFLDTVLSCGWLVLEDSGSPEIFLVRLPRRFIFGFPGYILSLRQMIAFVLTCETHKGEACGYS